LPFLVYGKRVPRFFNGTVKILIWQLKRPQPLIDAAGHLDNRKAVSCDRVPQPQELNLRYGALFRSISANVAVS
jgi:hypothetical protein